MDAPPIDMKPFYRYLLFQVPGWLVVSAVMGFLHSAAEVSATVGVGVVGFMVALDFGLYPLFRHSYTSRAQVGVEALSGTKGKVVRSLSPEGFVRVRGERWRARTLEPDGRAEEGETVEIMDARGLTLLVRPLES